MIKNNIVSFDFDGSINDHFNGTKNPQSLEVQELAKTLIAEGFSVHIVTRRYGPENSHKGIKNEHVEVYEIATKLGVSHDNVHFTNREWKYNKLNEIKADFHIDDDEQDISFIQMHCNGIVGFHLNENNGPWKFYNLLKI